MPDQHGNVVDNAEASQFELAVDGKTAFVSYLRRDGKLVLTHTEVPSEMEGQGVGSRLVKGVLEKARAEDMKVVPMCPFVRTYVERHPEYGSMVAD